MNEYLHQKMETFGLSDTARSDLKQLLEVEAWLKTASFPRNTVSAIRPHGKIRAEARLPTIEIGTEIQSFLPIEYFKSRSSQLFQGSEPYRRFLSSGTTAKDRSQSYFSQSGLEIYRLQALKAFCDVLHAMLGDGFASVRGLSLVPPVGVWPDSSLAQMVGWFREILPVQYTNAASLAGELRDAPVWIFSTALDLAEIADSGQTIPLPPNSLVFETGGNKGKRKEFSREWLYSAISRTFGIADHQIVSEYSMCELAAQAYDFVLPDDTGPRRFRFPFWVQCAATQGMDIATAQGKGSLLISDPLRIDYPWPLRVQDMVDLNPDQSFTFLGRAPLAQLKGCSLLSEELIGGKVKSVPASRIPRGAGTAIDPSERIVRVLHLLDNFLKSPGSLASLEAELGSRTAAKSALEDLIADLPDSSAAWLHSVGQTGAIPGQTWLMILPSNHSIAGIYPIAMGYAAGIKSLIRIPKRFAQSNSLISMFIARLQNVASEAILVISPDFRLGESALDPTIDAILVYGSEGTIAQIRSLVTCPVQGFGSKITISICDGTSCDEPALIKDAFSLAQTGCYSSRLILLKGDGQAGFQLGQRLGPAFAQFWQSPLTLEKRVSIDHEALRYCDEIETTHVVRKAIDSPFFPVVSRSAIHDCSDALAQSPFVLPIVCYEPGQDIANDYAMRPQFLAVTAHGLANRIPWDGTFQGQRLFSID